MSSPVLDLYEFGPFRLDVQRRILARGDEIVPLPPKTFELLVLLLHSEGRAVSKHELMAALWPDTFVEEANLSFQISTLRKALGNSGLQWIETLPKHGYRFAAEVKPTSLEDHDAARPVATAEGASARRDRRGIRTRTTWTAAVFVVLLVSASLYISTLKGRPTTPVKGAPSAALPLTAYQGFENAPAFHRMGVRSRSPGTGRDRTTTTSTSSSLDLDRRVHSRPIPCQSPFGASPSTVARNDLSSED